MRSVIQFAIALMCSMQSISAWCQTDTLKIRYLEEVVISSSRTDRKIGEIPRTIDVIDRDQIENSVYNSVGDLLSRQSGLYLVGANQTPGTNQALFMRGAASNQVLVMIDGVRITDPSSPNNAIDLSELSLAQVERIEILKGSHSTLYGSGAMGGVVNIITKTSAARGLHGAVSLLGGSFGNSSSNFTQQADLTYGLANGLYVNGSVYNQNVNGLNASLDTVANRSFAPDNDDFSKTDGTLKVGMRRENFDAFVSYRSVFQNADIDQGAFSDDDNSYLKFYRNFWTYGGAYLLSSKVQVKVVGSSSNLRRTIVNDSSLVAPGVYDHSFFTSQYNGNHQTYEGQLDFKTSRLAAIVGGGSYSESMDFNTYFFSSDFGGFESIVNYDTLDVSSHIGYLFGQATFDLDPASRLQLTVGGRYNNHSKFGSFFTYEINPSWRLNENMLLYASFSTGFNAPSLFQLFDPTPGNTFTRGNVNLQPEESQSAEIGFKKTFSARSFITASVFSTKTNNAIEYIFLWNNTTAVEDLSFLDYAGDSYVNVADQRVRGVEIAGSLGFGKFDFSGNVTLLNGTIDNSQSDLTNEYTANHHLQLFSNGAFLNSDSEVENLPRRPRLTSNLNLHYQWNEDMSIQLTHRLAGARYDAFYDPSLGPFGAQNSLEIRSYSLFDFGVNYQLRKWIRLAVQVENLFDEDYQEINGFATRGRSGYIKAIFKW